MTFRLDGELTINSVTDAFVKFRAVLDALGKEQQAHVQWVLAGLEHGSAVITARAEPLDDDAAAKIPALTRLYLAAAREVAAGAPEHERPLLRVVRDLAHAADDQHSVILETADDEVILSAPGRRAAKLSAAPKSTSLGIVRGRVETLSHRDGFRFSLYELATDRPVSCYLAADHEDVMRDAWGRVADVTGFVTRDGDSGRPLAIRQVTGVDVIDEGEAMGYLKARGVVKGTEPAEQVIRRIRDAN